YLAPDLQEAFGVGRHYRDVLDVAMDADSQILTAVQGLPDSSNERGPTSRPCCATKKPGMVTTCRSCPLTAPALSGPCVANGRSERRVWAWRCSCRHGSSNRRACSPPNSAGQRDPPGVVARQKMHMFADADVPQERVQAYRRGRRSRNQHRASSSSSSLRAN